MNETDAFQRVAAAFPIDRYMVGEESACVDIAVMVRRFLPAHSRILDIGAGPCDKTAVLQSLGYSCFACDDFGDQWHREDRNLEKIVCFAERFGVRVREMRDFQIPFPNFQFDMVMLNHVIEHLHESPRRLLEKAVEHMADGGLLFITVPSAVNIRKRVDVLLGKTNMPAYHSFFWNDGPWRGHIREYTRADLVSLCQYLGLDRVYLGGRHHMISRVEVPFPWCYKALTAVFPDLRDSWLLICKKPPGWTANGNRNSHSLRNPAG
jgi:SAM-dependent methyltransferase